MHEKHKKWINKAFKALRRKIAEADLTVKEREQAIELYTEMVYCIFNGSWIRADNAGS